MHQPTSALVVIDSDGTDLRQLTPDDGSWSSSWSPDGTQLAFTRDRHLFIMNADGTNVKTVDRAGVIGAPDRIAWNPVPR